MAEKSPILPLALLLGVGACGPTPERNVPSVPPQLRAFDAPTRIVADDLANPRGLLGRDGALLVAEAGHGNPDDPQTGRLLALRDLDGDGRLENRAVILDDQLSVNIEAHLAVHRDEVFGLADIERGGGRTLVSLAHPSDGSTLFELDGDSTRVFATTEDNANSIAYHPTLDAWFAVQSFANTVIEVSTGQTLATLPPLPDGQDAVPAAIAYEPATDALLVVNFSGQIGGDTRGSGVEFVRNSGTLVRIDARTGSITPVLAGLNAPVDVKVDRDGSIFIVEFCSDFLDPARGIGAARGNSGHGGFRRFSGRLLRLGVAGQIDPVADGLDLPTHLLIRDGALLVSVGQGTPGREIPGPDGLIPVSGSVLAIERAG